MEVHRLREYDQGTMSELCQMSNEKSLMKYDSPVTIDDLNDTFRELDELLQELIALRGDCSKEAFPNHQFK